MKKTKQLEIHEKFVYEVPILGDFSIIEPGGTFDDLDEPRAQLHIRFKDGLIIISIENICHPRGKITKKIRCNFTLGNLIETMAAGLGYDSSPTNDEDTYGYHVWWWHTKQPNKWIVDLLIIFRVFPEFAKALIYLPVVDLISLHERWGSSLKYDISKIRMFSYSFEWADKHCQFNFSLAQLAQLVGVSDCLDIEKISDLLQEIDSDNLIIPDDWERRQVKVRRCRIRRKPTILLEISACNTEDDLIVLLSKPPPASLESFSLALRRWISFGLGKESSSSNEVERNVAMISWLSKSKFIPALHDSEPELWSDYREILCKWSSDYFKPNHPMAGIIAKPKGLRRKLANEVLAFFSDLRPLCYQ